MDEHLVGEAVHVLATLWSGSGEYEAVDEPRADQHQLLRDVSAERNAEHVDLTQLEGVDKPEGVVRHRGDRARHGACEPMRESRAPGTVPAQSQHSLRCSGLVSSALGVSVSSARACTVL